MKACRRFAQVAALLASLSVAGGALAATPTSGGFKGSATGSVTFATTFKATDPLSFTVASAGKELVSFSYSDTVCDLASSKLIQVSLVKVAADGSFSVAALKSAPEGDALEDGHKVVTTTTLSGKFVSPSEATGTLAYTQKENNSPSSHCGPIKLAFTASAS